MNKFIVLGSVVFGICIVSLVVVGLMTDRRFNEIPSNSPTTQSSRQEVLPIPSNPPAAPKQVLTDADFPATKQAVLACKEITSELNQVHKALELGINYNRFCDLVQEKALAIEKIKDLRGDGIPVGFIQHANRCIERLNDSKEEWLDAIKAEDGGGLKHSCEFFRKMDWKQSEVELLYCSAIVDKDRAAIIRIDQSKKQLDDELRAYLDAGKNAR